MSRSEAVFQAKRKIRGRYQLCRICAKATRQLHGGHGRIEDTITVVLGIIGHEERMEPLLTSMLHEIQTSHHDAADEEYYAGVRY